MSNNLEEERLSEKDTTIGYIMQGDSPLSVSSDVYWRGGVWDCPHCDYSEDYDRKIWLEKGKVHQVLFKSAKHKYGACVIISECKSCQKLSWQHFDLSHLIKEIHHMERKEPIGIDKKIIEEVFENSIAQGQKDWDESLCKSCKWVTKVGDDCLYPRINCEAKLGKSSCQKSTSALKECKYYCKGTILKKINDKFGSFRHLDDERFFWGRKYGIDYKPKNLK